MSLKTIQELIDSGIIVAHKDGNYGSSYPRTTEFGDDGAPFLTAKLVSDDGRIDFSNAPRLSFEKASKLTYGFIESQDVLLSHNATVGRVAVVPDLEEPTLVGTSLTYFRLDRKRLLPRYLAAYFSGVPFQSQLRAMMSYSTRNQVPITSQRQLSVVVPSIEEQTVIAQTLGMLNDKIEQNRRTAQALEKLGQAIFRAWFVDFGPVKAKAAGATSFPSMPQPVFDALPTCFVDSGIGPIPKGWEVGAVQDLALLSKTQVKPQEHLEELFDHFSIPAFDAGTRAVVEPGSAIKSNKFLVVDGCALLSKLNPRIARIWLPPRACGRRQIASTEFLVFVPSEPSDRHYLYCQFQQREFREGLAQEASGTSNSHQRVQPKDVLSRPVVMPVPSVRIAFAGIADPLFALRSAIQDESEHLAAMRDYLLPKLLNGNIRVGDAERVLTTVA